MPEKVIRQVNQMKRDEPLTLELETVEGMNVTREELNKASQKKLSGRYGEWFKSIMWLIIATFVTIVTMFFASGRMMRDSLMQAYSYSFNESSSFFAVSILFWFVVMALAVVCYYDIKRTTGRRCSDS